MATRRHPPAESGSGVGTPIDIYGSAAFDPTQNVIALVEALAKSTADLRAADRKYADSEHVHLKEIGTIRAAHAETLRISDLDRLDKTRQVDVLAASASASALATAVQTLANTSDRNAETLRNLVNATAQTMAKQTTDQAQVLSTQTDNLVKDINARIAELQKSQYQVAGKTSATDPLQAEMIAELKAMRLAMSDRGGQSSGAKNMWAIISGVLLLVLAIGAFVVSATRG